MTSAFSDTILTTLIYVRSDQLTNDLSINRKNNLIEEHEKKCFKNYGYISKIYDETSVSNGVICSDNGYSPILYSVSFSCRLCKPLKGQELICKVQRITDELIRLENDAIKVFVTHDRINTQNFFVDSNNNIRLKDKVKKLTKHDYVKVIITATIFHDKDIVITALGTLTNIASDEDIKNFFEDKYH